MLEVVASVAGAVVVLGAWAVHYGPAEARPPWQKLAWELIAYLTVAGQFALGVVSSNAFWVFAALSLAFFVAWVVLTTRRLA